MYELVKWFLGCLEKFLRSHRYGLGQRIETRLYVIFEGLIRAKCTAVGYPPLALGPAFMPGIGVVVFDPPGVGWVEPRGARWNPPTGAVGFARLRRAPPTLRGIFRSAFSPGINAGPSATRRNAKQFDRKWHQHIGWEIDSHQARAPLCCVVIFASALSTDAKITSHFRQEPAGRTVGRVQNAHPSAVLGLLWRGNNAVSLGLILSSVVYLKVETMMLPRHVMVRV